VADCMYVVLHSGYNFSLSRAPDGRIMRYVSQLMPISCHFRNVQRYSTRVSSTIVSTLQAFTSYLFTCSFLIARMETGTVDGNETQE